MAQPTPPPMNGASPADETEAVANEQPAPEPPKAEPTDRRKRRKRSFNLTDEQKEDIVGMVLENHRRDIDDRGERIRKRMNRYAKLMGWLDSKDWPWANCSNMWLPVMLTASLRMKATLENAIKSTRPLMMSAARQRRNNEKTAKIDKILDYQFFQENNGEKKTDAFICNFVDDEAAYAFIHWVKEQQTINETKVLPAPSEQIPYTTQALLAIKDRFGDLAIASMKDNDGYSWEVEYEEEGEPSKARVEFYDRDDGRIEMCITRRATTFNGPAFEVLDFEDVVFPVRSANLQPPGPSNPLGAPYVNRICKASVDSIKRNKRLGIYDLLTDEDITKIEDASSSTGSGKDEEAPMEQKDALEGVSVSRAGEYADRQMVEHFGRWDIDGDGLEEDVIFTVVTDAKVLCRARLLTEVYPGLPIKRPFAHESFIPIPNRVLGLSLCDLLEPIQDAMKTMFDQHIDWGTITNMPWFVYRAASGFRPEVIRLQPGEGLPADDPSRDLAFPQFPTKDSGFALNTMAVLQQFGERLSMQNDTSFGRVPTGKASALRTVGTTMALLQQTDVRSEQVLRRLFHAYADAYQLIHSLNRRYLPEKKEIRIAGFSGPGQDAYDEIKPDDLDADVDFEFKASLLNTNRQVLQQELQQLMGILVSPLAIQLGIVRPEEVYRLMSDYVKALDMDAERYTTRPPGVTDGPKIMAEEAISAILDNEVPQGAPLEPAQEHMQKLMAFFQSDAFGLLNAHQLGIFKVYLDQVKQLVMMQFQQQQMMAAAAATNPQGPPQQEQQGPGGAMTTMQAPGMADNAPVGKGETIDESVNIM